MMNLLKVEWASLKCWSGKSAKWWRNWRQSGTSEENEQVEEIEVQVWNKKWTSGGDVKQVEEIKSWTSWRDWSENVKQVKMWNKSK